MRTVTKNKHILTPFHRVYLCNVTNLRLRQQRFLLINKADCCGYGMDEKWSIDFKKFKKSSSKKLIKGGLGFLLSPREEAKDNENPNANNAHMSSSSSSSRKSNNWDNEGLNLEAGETETEDKDYIDDIPIIPSLDDFADDDLTNQIAKAPLVGVKKVASYKDLETDLLKHSAFASLEEVNLQILIKLLHPESYLEEPDIPWTKDGLFNEMVSIFNERKL